MSVPLTLAVLVLSPNAVLLKDFVVTSVGGVESISYWNTAVLGAQPSSGSLAAVTQTQVDTALETARQSREMARYDLKQIERAEVLVLIDEVNSLRAWIESFKAAVAAASTLADLKTRVAALSAMPARTAAQARTAVVNKLAAL